MSLNRRLHRIWIPLFVIGLCAVPAGAGSLPEPVLEGYYDRWLAGVSAWMLEPERRAFEALVDDPDREVFIRRFWQARATSPGDDGDQALARWHLNFEEARHRFDSLSDERAQALLIAGKPAEVVVFAGCRNLVRPLRVWVYEGWHGRQGDGREGMRLVFWLDGGTGGDFRLWSPDDGTTPLIFDGPARYRPWTIEDVIGYTKDNGCFRWSPGDASVVADALRDATGDADLRRALPPPPDLAWLDRLAADLAGGAGAQLPATVEFQFPGRYQRKTVVQGRVAVPAATVRRNAEGLLFDRFAIAGDVRQGQRLVDAFRVVHLVAGAAPEAAGPIVLDFYRRLRPGSYTVDLRVEDARGLALLRRSRRLEVPAVEAEAEPPAGRQQGLPGLTRAEAGVLTTFPGVEILPPADELLLGEVEVAAVTTGGPIERLEFLLDGEPAGGDDEPPWAAALDLGDAPRPRRVEAVAFDPAGREIARGAATLGAGRPFAVRLVAPLPGSGGRRAEVEVDVPAGRRLDRLELFVNEERVATLHEPPFSHPLPAPEPGVTTYVRALATLDGGEAREDLVFVHSPNPFDRVDVRLVELYTSVRDRRGRFVKGLTIEDFRVLEDGAPQRIRRFDTVENLAINVAILMDVSSSMRRKIGVATRSARHFFEAVLTDRDRASLLTFNHDVRRVVPFTNDVDDLRHGVSGFRAWGTTRLFDGMVYALHSFGGLDGKRALVLLSDGHDVDSDFTFKQVFENVLRSGVAVYPIALGLDTGALSFLAEASGGRSFRIADAGGLDAIYRLIEEELRSQYLLVYEPPAGTRRELRRVEVEVLREGLEARSIHGYYP